MQITNIKPKQQRIIFVSSIILISLISLIYIITNFNNNIVFFYSPNEMEKIKNAKNIIRVGGMIVKNSIKKIDATTTEFVITDYAENLAITYSGILPDLFREEQGVVAKGQFNIENNKFYTQELLIKHDENYMPPEVAKNLKMKVSE
jgi:cytochrome c-type biogenesis protein CcmE